MLTGNSATLCGDAMSSYEQHKPDWAFWRVLPAVAPWEAVALSMDVEPRKLLAHPYGGGASGVAVSLIPPLGFSERLELANRCIGSEMLPGVEPLSGTEPAYKPSQHGPLVSVGRCPRSFCGWLPKNRRLPTARGYPANRQAGTSSRPNVAAAITTASATPQPPSGRECCSNG